MSKHLSILFILIGFMFSCSNTGEHKNHTETELKDYTCPMHPQIIRNEPGQCPICGMKLVEKIEHAKSIKDTSILLLLKPTNEYILSKINTISAKQLEFPLEIEAIGTIVYDTREINTVSARVSGWIEKLYVKYQFQKVTKGDILMDIYSKELLTEQENFLYLLKNDAENNTLLNAAKNRLLLLGLTKNQIEQIKQRKTIFHSISIYSPYSGHLHDLVGNQNANNQMNKSEQSSADLIIKEGTYIKSGENIFTIYNTEKVWALIDIYTDQFELLKLGQKVSILVNGNEQVEFEGTIDFIEPIYKSNSKTTSARVYLNNANQDLKIGQIIKAKINAGIKKGIFIPSKAITHLGNEEIVFIKENNILRAHAIITGIITKEFTEVISGISAQDKIAENAQMLIDSESFIKLNYEE